MLTNIWSVGELKKKNDKYIESWKLTTKEKNKISLVSFEFLANISNVPLHLFGSNYMHNSI